MVLSKQTRPIMNVSPEIQQHLAQQQQANQLRIPKVRSQSQNKLLLQLKLSLPHPSDK
jgi:hypothetical protein